MCVYIDITDIHTYEAVLQAVKTCLCIYIGRKNLPMYICIYIYIHIYMYACMYTCCCWQGWCQHTAAYVTYADVC